MFGLGASEILVILVIAFLVLGPTQLPKLMRDIGKAIREFRKSADDVRQEFALDEELRQPLEELRQAVTLTPEELRMAESGHPPRFLPPDPKLPNADADADADANANANANAKTAPPRPPKP